MVRSQDAGAHGWALNEAPSRYHGVGSRFRAAIHHMERRWPKTTPDPFRRSTKKHLAECL
jgi:hypothetical protein